MWQKLGEHFHVYGLILGLSIWLGYAAIHYKAQHRHLPIGVLEALFPGVIVGGLVGARLYHVLTDWSRYQDQLLAIFQVWQGGLSIIGALLGGAVAVAFVYPRLGVKESVVVWLDLVIFGVPIAQMVGRLGNALNQELYGLPSTLPWALYVTPDKRLPGYEMFERFHPLFAYEMFLTAVIGLSGWWLEAKFHHQPDFKIGSGVYIAGYVVCYAVGRLLLDFLRLDKAIIAPTQLGVNQVVLGIIAVVTSYWYLRRRQRYAT